MAFCLRALKFWDTFQSWKTEIRVYDYSAWGKAVSTAVSRCCKRYGAKTLKKKKKVLITTIIILKCRVSNANAQRLRKENLIPITCLGLADTTGIQHL